MLSRKLKRQIPNHEIVNVITVPNKKPNMLTVCYSALRPRLGYNRKPIQCNILHTFPANLKAIEKLIQCESMVHRTDKIPHRRKTNKKKKT